MDIQSIWQEHGTTIVVGAVVAVLAFVAYKLLKPKQKVIGENMTLNVRCKCGWQGTVTKYNQVCRKCNSKELKPF